MNAIKDFVRARPPIYDRVRSLKRSFLGAKSASFVVLDEFSRAHNGEVNFVQIGANDGLRNDPLRPFIVRDDWQGVLIEPLPTVFPLLQKNYRYLRRPGLVFANVAVTVDGRDALSFWSYRDEFLATQNLEDRLSYLRKASFDRNHVESFLPDGVDPEKSIQEIRVPCSSLAAILRERLPRGPLHLLAIDAEGYESTLIPGIDFSTVTPDAVFFESEHLGPDRERVFSHLQKFGYQIESVGCDSLAVRIGSAPNLELKRGE